MQVDVPVLVTGAELKLLIYGKARHDSPVDDSCREAVRRVEVGLAAVPCLLAAAVLGEDNGM